MALKRVGAIHMKNFGPLATLFADATRAAAWTGAVGGHWHETPLEGFGVSAAGEHGVLGAIEPVTVVVLEVFRDDAGGLLAAAQDWTYETPHKPGALAKLPAATVSDPVELEVTTGVLAVLDARMAGAPITPAKIEAAREKPVRMLPQGIVLATVEVGRYRLTRETVDLGPCTRDRLRLAR